MKEKDKQEINELLYGKKEDAPAWKKVLLKIAGETIAREINDLTQRIIDKDVSHGNSKETPRST